MLKIAIVIYKEKIEYIWINIHVCDTYLTCTDIAITYSCVGSPNSTTGECIACFNHLCGMFGCQEIWMMSGSLTVAAPRYKQKKTKN